MSETTHKWTIDDARRMAPEAMRDAIERYPSNVEGAIIFFAYAIGLGIAEPTEDDIKWAMGLKREGQEQTDD